MGKGSHRQRCPPGGVIWWDQYGMRHHSLNPPSAPGVRPTLCLFVLGGILVFPCIGLFAVAAFATLENKLHFVLSGLALGIVEINVLYRGWKCSQIAKKHTITLYFPGTGGEPVNGVTIEPCVKYVTG